LGVAFFAAMLDSAFGKTSVTIQRCNFGGVLRDAFGFYGGIGSLLDPPQGATSGAIMDAI
jgi:hypothetical protein